MNPDALIYICEICQTVLDEHHCKAVCPNCGRMLDCSDLALIHANAKVGGEDHQFVLRPGSDAREMLPRMGPPDETAMGEPASSVANLP